jgi:hypothetical protein
MHKKPTLLYSAGCYGAFCLQMLNLNEIIANESYHNQPTDYQYTQPNRPDHHLIKEEEIDCLIEKEVTKYTYALDEQLKLINREEFFKQFLHPSLRTDEFIDIDKN